MVLLIIAVGIADVMAQDNGTIYDSAKKRDPFIPYVTNDGQLINIREEGEDININLEGIFYDKDGQSMVIINGEILRKNDTIGNIKIVEVKRDGIVYSKKGEIYTLSAKKED
ncbi:MAG: general secretion pathway protein GspB [Candidatus Omnitrophica bacterium]|nr:general secretion pathway protein GspB [Candidatus Omnitrophota bacterium]MDD5355438.1 general secretion pathway protein GspB [Candidatus Omnitrophota bacterium]